MLLRPAAALVAGRSFFCAFISGFPFCFGWRDLPVSAVAAPPMVGRPRRFRFHRLHRGRKKGVEWHKVAFLVYAGWRSVAKLTARDCDCAAYSCVR
jgi:hypothetical protein